jgi:hypothetical protein
MYRTQRLSKDFFLHTVFLLDETSNRIGGSQPFERHASACVSAHPSATQSVLRFHICQRMMCSHMFKTAGLCLLCRD